MKQIFFLGKHILGISTCNEVSKTWCEKQMMTDALMPESSNPLVNASQAVLDRGRSCAAVSSYSEMFSHIRILSKMGLMGVLSFLFCLVCLFLILV